MIVPWGKDIDRLTKELQIQKVNSIATNRAFISLLQKYLPQSAMTCAKDLDTLFKEHFKVLTGIDPVTRISIGQIIVTKYVRGGKVKKWSLGRADASVPHSTTP